VIYPTIIKKKKATNYIFVPNKNNTTPPKFLNSTLLYLIPNELHWISTHVQKNLREKTSIYKQGTFLFGDAAFPTLPHLAQGGNQILEDAVFLKNFLEHSDNLDELVNSFIRARYLKRDLISKKSELIGKLLSSKNLTGHIRNFAIQSNGKDLIDNFLNPIWTS
jgi:2-polyprenyl-6-methoxyphenol hydroxylase-like FAD-dependent oxidoreductase